MTDYIDRQALCDDLREYKVHPVPISSDESEVKGYNDGIDLVISVIAEFPSAEPERKWIPVTDRLPKDNRQVLVYAQSTHFALAKYDEMREANGEYRKQWVTFDAWKPYYIIKNVIAWMPLPEPYGGDR